jgi:superfamily II DNA or RNA helicase
MPRFTTGALVRCREREWVVLPSPDQDLLLLRPLGGSEAETCGIFLPIEGDAVAEASFAPPDPAHMGDFEAGSLLRDAARLSLRSGAGPFRSLGRISVRPRPYQLVPLLMALRLETVRLLIADDVGIGKTIEAGLIVRELFDRGEIRRLTVLCPPHLCDQWQRELAEKFGLDAVVVRSSTAAGLERSLPHADVSIWEHYPITVASIDYVKSEHRRDNFLRAAPELVIVDEAHTATDSGGRGTQQQRYELVREVAESAERHLLLLTATPHSGIEDAFRSLLGLIAPRFATLNLDRLSEVERDDLARHFVQRRRADVRHWLAADTPFPQRESSELTYSLARTAAYRELFDDVYGFTRELVRDEHGPAVSAVRRRARYWAALALLRCVMSSPAAAEKALRTRSEAGPATTEGANLEADLLRPFVLDSADQEQAHDLEPVQAVDLLEAAGTEEAEPVLVTTRRSERERLRRFAARAAALQGRNDPKLQALLPLLNELLQQGYHPIVYCRYIATANYLAEQLAGQLKAPGGALLVLAVTGDRSEEERETLIAELAARPRRLLVATDCLSEGINLQHAFNAVIHYDLPWNPNRLEQREGRVDRYGQSAPVVRTAMLYGKDNPMDEAVMQVLLRKAVSIHRALGISVPLPVDHGTVVNTLIASLFEAGPRQLALFDPGEPTEANDAGAQLTAIEQRWDDAVAREKLSRTRFAQRRIKPEEVARELEESDAALGDAAAVERFVRAACARLGMGLPAYAAETLRRSDTQQLPTDAFELRVNQLPPAVQEQVTHLADRAGVIRLAFDEPAPEGVTLLGRNHPLVTALADYLLETALAPDEDTPVAARASVIRTTAVTRRTRLLLLRVRMLIEPARRRAGHEHDPPLLAEELLVAGFGGRPDAPAWLDQTEALTLLETARPAANMAADERSLALQSALSELPTLNEALAQIADERAGVLREAHQRVRAQTRGTARSVRPAGPPDLLGLYVLLPMVC